MLSAYCVCCRLHVCSAASRTCSSWVIKHCQHSRPSLQHLIAVQPKQPGWGAKLSSHGQQRSGLHTQQQQQWKAAGCRCVGADQCTL
jgi:hypothetical protein